MDTRKIITLLGQKHNYKDLGEIFTEASEEEKEAILYSLGLDTLVSTGGGIIPRYHIDIISDKPVFIQRDYNITITGKVYNFFDLVPDTVLREYTWTRDSGNIVLDEAWAVGKNTQSLDLKKEDFPNIENKDTIFKLKVTIGGRSAEDIITFTRNETLSKIQIKSTTQVFLDNSPATAELSLETKSEVESYAWYLNDFYRGNSETFTIDYSDIIPGSVGVIKAEVTTPSGEILTDTYSIPRVKNGVDGQGVPGPTGPPGINGTTGPSPRLLEFVPGATYENGDKYIDYAYFRSSNPSTEGWYTVKLPAGHIPGTRVTVVYPGGIPDILNSFVKAPFTKEMSFGTIVAEQANLAGFIFRNQKLYSQENSGMTCSGVTQEYPNLMLDGLLGVIKFLNRMVMDKSGIVLKDDCGKRRMAFQWDSGFGVPILRFYAEDGITVTWEAGQGGYKIIAAIPNKYEEYRALHTSIPLAEVPTTVTAAIYKSYLCRCGTGAFMGTKTIVGVSTPLIGYKFVVGTSEVAEEIAANGKITKFQNYNNETIDDGWYLASLDSIDEYLLGGSYEKVVDGKILSRVDVQVDLTVNGALFPCGGHGFPPCG